MANSLDPLGLDIPPQQRGAVDLDPLGLGPEQKEPSYLEAAKVGLKSGLAGAARMFEIPSRAIEKLGGPKPSWYASEYLEPTREEQERVGQLGIPGQVVSGLTTLPGAALKYGPLMALGPAGAGFGALAGMAGLFGAERAAEEFVAPETKPIPEIGLAALEDAIVGGVFKGIEPLGRLARSAILGGTFGGQSALDTYRQTGDIGEAMKAGIAPGIVGAGLGLLHGRKGPLPPPTPTPGPGYPQLEYKPGGLPGPPYIGPRFGGPEGTVNMYQDANGVWRMWQPPAGEIPYGIPPGGPGRGTWRQETKGTPNRPKGTWYYDMGRGEPTEQPVPMSPYGPGGPWEGRTQPPPPHPPTPYVPGAWRMAPEAPRAPEVPQAPGVPELPPTPPPVKVQGYPDDLINQIVERAQGVGGEITRAMIKETANLGNKKATALIESMRSAGYVEVDPKTMTLRLTDKVPKPGDNLRWRGELYELRDIVASGQPAWKKGVETRVAGQEETVGWGTSYPPFMQDMGWTKNEVTQAIDMGMAGHKFVGVPNKKGVVPFSKLKKIWEAANNEAKGMYVERRRAHLQDLFQNDQRFTKPETVSSLTNGINDENIDVQEGLREEGYSEEEIQSVIREAENSYSDEAPPSELAEKELFDFFSAPEQTQPILSPVARRQFLLPGQKIGIPFPEGKIPGGRVTGPLFEGLPPEQLGFFGGKTPPPAPPAGPAVPPAGPALPTFPEGMTFRGENPAYNPENPLTGKYVVDIEVPGGATTAYINDLSPAALEAKKREVEAKFAAPIPTPVPELSPVEKGQYKLPGVKIGPEFGKKGAPVAEGEKPALFAAAEKAAAEKAQPSLLAPEKAPVVGYQPPAYPKPEQYFSEKGADRSVIENYEKAWKAWVASIPEEEPVVFQSQNMVYVITRDTLDPAKWRASSFSSSDHMPWGHEIYNTKEEALREHRSYERIPDVPFDVEPLPPRDELGNPLPQPPVEEPVATPPVVAGDPVINPQDIDLTLAERAHSGTSWVPEQRAKGEQRAYVSEMTAVWDKLKRLARTPEQLDIARTEFERYKAEWVKRYSDVLGSRSRLVSTFIAGPSKFPSEMMNKRNNAYDNKVGDFLAWDAKVQNSIMNKIRPKFISSDREDAVPALQAKIDSAKKMQDIMKKANEVIRRKISDQEKVKAIIDLGLSETTAAKLLKPDFAGRIGFPSYELQNNLANIKRMEQRVSGLVKEKGRPAAATREFEGGKVIENEELNRIQIFFDGKPGPEMIKDLKSNGFHWSPKEGAWQRLKNENTRNAVARILKLNATPEVGKIPVPAEEPIKFQVPEYKEDAVKPITPGEPASQEILARAYEIQNTSGMGFTTLKDAIQQAKQELTTPPSQEKLQDIQKAVAGDEKAADRLMPAPPPKEIWQMTWDEFRSPAVGGTLGRFKEAIEKAAREGKAVSAENLEYLDNKTLRQLGGTAKASPLLAKQVAQRLNPVVRPNILPAIEEIIQGKEKKVGFKLGDKVVTTLPNGKEFKGSISEIDVDGTLRIASADGNMVETTPDKVNLDVPYISNGLIRTTIIDGDPIYGGGPGTHAGDVLGKYGVIPEGKTIERGWTIAKEWDENNPKKGFLNNEEAADYIREKIKDTTPEEPTLTEEAAPKEPPKIGRAYIRKKGRESWRTFIDAEEITRGKQKGKIRVTLTNGEKVVVDKSEIKMQGEGGPELRTGEAPEEPLTRESVEGFAREKLKEYKNSPDIEILDQADIPDRLLQGLQDNIRKGIKGIYDPFNKKIYLIRDMMGSEADILSTIEHEAVGHFGMESILGKESDTFFNRVYMKYGKKTLEDIADERGFDLGTKEGQLKSAREYVARMAETGENPGLLKQFYAWVRQTINKLSGGRIFKDISDSEIKTMLKQARDFVRSDTDTQWRQNVDILKANIRGAAVEPMFSFKKTAKEIGKVGFEQELKPRWEGLKKAWKWIKNSLTPTIGVAIKDLNAFSRLLGDREVYLARIEIRTEQALRELSKLSRNEQIEFIDKIQNGDIYNLPPNMKAIERLHREIEDELWKTANIVLSHMDEPERIAYLEHHVRNFWKVVPKGSIEEINKRGFSGLWRRPIEGTKASLHHQYWTLKEGMANGGEPVTTNLMEILRLNYEDTMKLITARRMWDSLLDTGHRVFIKWGEAMPEGFSPIEDPIASRYFPKAPPKIKIMTPEGAKMMSEYEANLRRTALSDPDPAKRTEAAMMLNKWAQGWRPKEFSAGRWVVEDNAARLLRNYLGRDRVRENPLLNSLMGIKNITTAFELGFSAFHAAFETFEAMASQMGLGMRMAWNQNKVAEGIKEMLSAPAAPYMQYKIGRQVLRYFKDPEAFARTTQGQKFLQQFPNASEAMGHLFWGGGSIRMNEAYKISSLNVFRENLNSKNYIGAAMRSIPAFSQWVMKPLFENYIPSIKRAVFFKEFSNEVLARSADITAGKITKAEIARDVWHFVENRFGEMNFDNLWWNRTMKSGLQLGIRSVTWKLGNIRSYGKAVTGQSAELLAAMRERRMPQLSQEMAWVWGLGIVTAAMASVTQYMFTGKNPENWKDLVYPQIDNQGGRISLPTYMRDLFHISHAPVKYVTSSMAGWVGRFLDVINNKDFYGVQVHDPNENAVFQRVHDALHMLPLPFSFTSFTRMREEGETPFKQALGFIGGTKAPYWIERTDAEQKSGELKAAHLPVGGRSPADFERGRILKMYSRQYEAAKLRGENTEPIIGKLHADIKAGKLFMSDMLRFRERVRHEPLVSSVEHLPFKDVIEVWKVATTEEKAKLYPILMRKFVGLRNMEDRVLYFPKMREIKAEYKP